MQKLVLYTVAVLTAYPAGVALGAALPGRWTRTESAEPVRVEPVNYRLAAGSVAVIELHVIAPPGVTLLISQ